MDRHREGHCCLVFELNFLLHEMDNTIKSSSGRGVNFLGGQGARVNFHWPRNKCSDAERINVFFRDSHPILSKSFMKLEI